jgi:hypothetical protein
MPPNYRRGPPLPTATRHSSDRDRETRFAKRGRRAQLTRSREDATCAADSCRSAAWQRFAADRRDEDKDSTAFYCRSTPSPWSFQVPSLTSATASADGQVGRRVDHKEARQPSTPNQGGPQSLGQDGAPRRAPGGPSPAGACEYKRRPKSPLDAPSNDCFRRNHRQSRILGLWRGANDAKRRFVRSSRTASFRQKYKKNMS